MILHVRRCRTSGLFSDGGPDLEKVEIGPAGSAQRPILVRASRRSAGVTLLRIALFRAGAIALLIELHVAGELARP